MGLRDYLVFDGVPSTDFNIYVSGEGTFNAPEKMYNSYEVSGRSGDVKMFTGRYKNITVTYTCFYKFHKPGNDFKRDIDGFRAFLLSKEGYCRLEDTHHKEEYRMAVYKGGFEIDPSEHNIAAVFTLTFDCMPQRFLKSGEEPIEIEDSYEYYTYIKNPTLFPSSPLVQIYGYGELQLNDYKINIQNLTYGGINVADFVRETSSYDLYCYFKPWLYNVGDVAWIQAHWWIKFIVYDALPNTITFETVSTAPETIVDLMTVDADGVCTVGVFLQEEFNSFLIGEPETEVFNTTVRVNYISESTGQSDYMITTISEVIDAEEDRVVLHGLSLSNGGYIRETKQVEEIHCYSTASVLGNPLNVDMETGDAYKIENGVKTYVNNAVWVGEKLPKLMPGDNPIVQDATMSKVVIIPRWWTI